MPVKPVLAVVALALCLAGCGLGGVRGTSFRVPSASMAPTLKVGQVVDVDRGAFSRRSPRVGEIIVFRGSDQAASTSDTNECANPRQGQAGGEPCAVPGTGPSKVSFIRRVVGLPGDRIAIVGGQVVRNGQALREPYARACSDPICNFRKTIAVPPQTYFVLGDNRGESLDSRFSGPVPRSWIVGLAKP
jgi:signal peptidase I